MLRSIIQNNCAGINELFITFHRRKVLHSLLSCLFWNLFQGFPKNPVCFIDLPLAFSDKDPQGYLVQGFNEPISIATHCNYEYLITHLEALGFTKDIDLVVYKIPIPDQTPELYLKVAERAKRNNPGFKLLEFTRVKGMKP